MLQSVGMFIGCRDGHGVLECDFGPDSDVDPDSNPDSGPDSDFGPDSDSLILT